MKEDAVARNAAQRVQEDDEARERRLYSTPDGQFLIDQFSDNSEWLLGQAIVGSNEVGILLRTGIRTMVLFTYDALVKTGIADGTAIYRRQLVDHEWRYVKQDVDSIRHHGC